MSGEASIEWDEATPNGVAYKAINTAFLADMEGDFCLAQHINAWGRVHRCIRVNGHTGRHLATEWRCRYPTAVWR